MVAYDEMMRGLYAQSPESSLSWEFSTGRPRCSASRTVSSGSSGSGALSNTLIGPVTSSGLYWASMLSFESVIYGSTGGLVTCSDDGWRGMRTGGRVPVGLWEKMK